jgi:hypothetical protein
MNPLHWVFQFVFGCHHRHMSRVFTIKKRTYKVCLDCGHEFELPDVCRTARSNIAESVAARLKIVRQASASIF